MISPALKWRTLPASAAASISARPISANSRTLHTIWQYFGRFFAIASVLSAYEVHMTPCGPNSLRVRVFTDLPTWPGVLPVLVTCALCNGTVLMYLQGQALPYLGTVRWLHGVWLVWCKPVRGAAARQDSGWW